MLFLFLIAICTWALSLRTSFSTYVSQYGHSFLSLLSLSLCFFIEQVLTIVFPACFFSLCNTHS